MRRTAPNRVLLYMNNLRFYLNRWFYCTALLECAILWLLYGTEAQEKPNTTYPFLSNPKNSNVQQYIPIWEVLWNTIKDITEIYTPKGLHAQ